MAVTKQIYAAIAPWSVTSVCDALKTAFIDAGLMTAWYDSFTSNGREHRVLQVTYDAAKTYGKTYYWFTFDGVGIYVRSTTGWNATTHIPAGPSDAGTTYVDYYNTDTTVLTYTPTLLTVAVSTSISITRYTSSGRSFFTLRTGTNYRTFTIDPASTSFRSFYDLNLGSHNGLYVLSASSPALISFFSIYQIRRDLLIGSSMNLSNSNYNNQIQVSSYALPINCGTYGYSSLPNGGGLLLPGWTVASNPSVGNDLNPVFNQLRLTSIHTADLPADFGIASIKTSNILAIQDNATVSAGVEEYEILVFANNGTVNGITNNPVFLARTI
jgi:hypothetical protein